MLSQQQHQLQKEQQQQQQHSSVRPRLYWNPLAQGSQTQIGRRATF